MSKTLIITPLVKASHSLEAALDQSIDEFLRDVVIQRFKCVCDLAKAAIKHVLFITNNLSSNISMSELVFKAEKLSLIENAKTWKNYFLIKSQSIYAYDEGVAKKIYRTVNDFLPSLKFLLTKIQTFA